MLTDLAIGASVTLENWLNGTYGIGVIESIATERYFLGSPEPIYYVRMDSGVLARLPRDAFGGDGAGLTHDTAQALLG